MRMPHPALPAQLTRLWPAGFENRLFEGWEHLLFIPDHTSLDESIAPDEPPFDGRQEPSMSRGDGR